MREINRNDLVGERFKMDVRAYDEDNAVEREVEVVSVAETKPDRYGCRTTRIAVRVMDGPCYGRVIFGVTPGQLGIALAW